VPWDRRIAPCDEISRRLYREKHAEPARCADRLWLVRSLLLGTATQVMPERSEDDPPVRAREILKHYVEHPGSADSLEGIAEWLLLEEVVQRRVEETRQALHWLVKHDYLERTADMVASPPLYRLNADKLDEAERLLQISEPAPRQRVN
jgi:hypothetical protein